MKTVSARPAQRLDRAVHVGDHAEQWSGEATAEVCQPHPAATGQWLAKPVVGSEPRAELLDEAVAVRRCAPGAGERLDPTSLLRVVHLNLAHGWARAARANSPSSSRSSIVAITSSTR
jgi:hypothetical protein